MTDCNQRALIGPQGLGMSVAYLHRQSKVTPFMSLFKNSRIEILSGLTVALALVPEAVAFAFLAKTKILGQSTLVLTSRRFMDTCIGARQFRTKE